MPVEYRRAGPADSAAIALLHADSWRRHYRGAYPDEFLDQHAVADRLEVWRKRLAAPAAAGRQVTIVAEDEGRIFGFVHLMLDLDDEWGTLVDNLHVGWQRQREGIGSQLLRNAARVVLESATSNAVHLWVVDGNDGAIAFYQAHRGEVVDQRTVPAPGGGEVTERRVVWPQAWTVGARDD